MTSDSRPTALPTLFTMASQRQPGRAFTGIVIPVGVRQMTWIGGAPGWSSSSSESSSPVSTNVAICGSVLCGLSDPCAHKVESVLGGATNLRAGGGARRFGGEPAWDMEEPGLSCWKKADAAVFGDSGVFARSQSFADRASASRMSWRLFDLDLSLGGGRLPPLRSWGLGRRFGVRSLLCLEVSAFFGVFPVCRL